MVVLQKGDTLGGDFTIDRLVAEGGFGSVYLAQQQSLQRACALKVLHSHLNINEKICSDFIREAQHCARVANPYIVEIYGSGVEKRTRGDLQESIFWLAMEFLKGRTLFAELQRRTCLPVSEVSVILKQLCYALQAMHDEGLIHRDLKPDNIFCLEKSRIPDEPFMIKLLDLGISKDIRNQTSKATTGLVGTPLYMAPEQLETSEEKRRIGPSTDLWALGLIVYQMLTGTTYWKAPRLKNSDHFVLFSEIRMDDLPPASERARESRSGNRLPSGFDDWFAQCVERDSRKRFPTAANAYEAFRRITEGQVVMPLPTTLRSKNMGPTKVLQRSEHSRFIPTSEQTTIGNSSPTSPASPAQPLIYNPAPIPYPTGQQVSGQQVIGQPPHVPAQASGYHSSYQPLRQSETGGAPPSYEMHSSTGAPSFGSLSAPQTPPSAGGAHPKPAPLLPELLSTEPAYNNNPGVPPSVPAVIYGASRTSQHSVYPNSPQIFQLEEKVNETNGLASKVKPWHIAFGIGGLIVGGSLFVFLLAFLILLADGCLPYRRNWSLVGIKVP
jgi:serine/threonine protein kinase